MREIENAERFFKEADKLIAYANSSPRLIACLYDADLLAEQLEVGSRPWLQMLIIIDHWRTNEEAWQEKLA